MLVAIDAGNTDIHFGLHDGTAWVSEWRIPTLKAKNGTWGPEWKKALGEVGKDPILKKVVISSVVPELNPSLRKEALKSTAVEPLFVGPSIYPRLEISIHNPEQIGTDLVANAVAAYSRFRTACLIIDFGTALTFTTLNENGKIIGVAIAPGLKTALKALALNAAQLPEVPLEVPKTALGTNTVEAIQAGTVMGYTGMVNYMIERIREETTTGLMTIATGGLSHVLEPLQASFDAIDRRLTLEGLRLIAGQAGN